MADSDAIVVTRAAVDVAPTSSLAPVPAEMTPSWVEIAPEVSASGAGGAVADAAAPGADCAPPEAAVAEATMGAAGTSATKGVATEAMADVVGYEAGGETGGEGGGEGGEDVEGSALSVHVAVEEMLMGSASDPRAWVGDAPRAVRDGLWLGGAACVEGDSDGVLDAGISHVLNVSASVPMPTPPRGEPPFVCRRVAVADDADAAVALEECAAFVHAARELGGSALVLGRTGGDRAAAVCIYHLLRHARTPLADALAAVRAAHPGAMPSIGLMQRLVECEARLLGPPTPSLSIDAYRWAYIDTLANSAAAASASAAAAAADGDAGAVAGADTGRSAAVRDAVLTQRPAVLCTLRAGRDHIAQLVAGMRDAEPSETR